MWRGVAKNALTRAGRWVVKIGSALLTNDGQGLDIEALKPWVAQLAALRRDGVELVVVVVRCDCGRDESFRWTQRPKEVHSLQACAALGQMGLVQAWETEFKIQGFKSAQILLTHDDLSDRSATSMRVARFVRFWVWAWFQLLMKTIPLSPRKFAFGDNDTLAALVANLIEADVLVIPHRPVRALRSGSS